MRITLMILCFFSIQTVTFANPTFKTSVIGERFYLDNSVPSLGEAYRYQFERRAGTEYFPSHGTIWGSPAINEYETLRLSQSRAERYCRDLGLELPTRPDYETLAALMGFSYPSHYSIYATDGTELLPGNRSNSDFWTRSIYKLQSGNTLSYVFTTKDGFLNLDYHANLKAVRCIARSETCSPDPTPRSGIDGEWRICMPVEFNFFSKDIFSDGHQSMQVNLYVKNNNGSYAEHDSGLFYSGSIYSSHGCKGEVIWKFAPHMRDLGYKLSKKNADGYFVDLSDNNDTPVNPKDPKYNGFEKIKDPQNTFEGMINRIEVMEIRGDQPKFLVRVGSDFWLNEKSGNGATSLVHTTSFLMDAQRLPRCAD